MGDTPTSPVKGFAFETRAGKASSRATTRRSQTVRTLLEMLQESLAHRREQFA